MLLHLLQEECVDHLSTTQTSQVTINSYHNSAISSVSGYNSGIETKSVDGIPTSDNSVSRYEGESSDNKEKFLS